MNSPKKFISLVIVVLFAFAIYSPLIGAIIQEDRAVSPGEKRVLAQLPGLPTDTKTLQEYPQKLEEYFNDQFGMREFFILTFAKIKALIGDTAINSSGGDAPTGNTIKGKDGWYFLNRVWDGDPISDYRNISLYSETELLRATFVFAARSHWLQQLGIKYLLFFAPNKHTIYSEYMPDYIVKQGNTSSMDQLYASLEKNTSIHFVDLRDTLRKGKKDAHLYWKEGKEGATLYFKTDSHWNGAGANLAQYGIAKKIEQIFPGKIQAAKRGPDDFTMFTGPGDIANIMGRTDLDAYGPVLFTGKCSTASAKEYELREQVTTCATGKLNVLIFHDSFYPALKPFFADYFARTTFIWREMTQQEILEQLKKGRIDLIIEERAERFLPYSPPINSELYNDFWAEQWRYWEHVVYRLDQQKAAALAKGYAGENVRLQFDKEKQSLEIQAITQDPGLILTNIPFTRDRLYMAYIEIESERDTQLELYYSTTNPVVPIPNQSNMETYSITAGLNKIYIPLFSGNLGTTLKIDPGTIPGRYRLNKFEIKEVDPASLQKTKR